MRLSTETMYSFFSVAFIVAASLAAVYRLLKSYVSGGICRSKASMEGKTVIITGANTGIGKETAMDLAKRGARVIMACRDLNKGEAALKDIVEKSGNTKVTLRQLDLASMRSIDEFAEDINQNETQLHVLINNAGLAYPSQLKRTKDGFEITMGVNHLGHFLLTNLLLDLLRKSSPARIVVVSSSAHQSLTKEMKFDNINSEKFYNRWDSYGQSKLANILFARELAKRLEGSGVTVNSLHPGVILTGIVRHLNRVLTFFITLLINIFCKTPEQGAQTTIHLAVCEEVELMSGLYFADCKPQEPSKAAQDEGAAKKLWEMSADLVGLDTTI